MARIRSIKPEFWSDRKLAERLSRDARLLYVSLWNMADEHGRLQGDTRWIKGHCLPYDDDLNLRDVERLLTELVTGGWAVRYEVDDDPYLFLPKLAEHQRLEPEKSKSRLPAPEDASAAQDDPSLAQIFPDNPAPIVVQQVAGSRLQVAGIAPQSDARKVPAPRKAKDTVRDDVWDALLEACRVDPAGVNDLNRGSYNVAAKALRDASATPLEIRRRATAYRQRWPDTACTPTALAKHWPELAGAAPLVSTGQSYAPIPDKPDVTPESVTANAAAARAALKASKEPA